MRNLTYVYFFFFYPSTWCFVLDTLHISWVFNAYRFMYASQYIELFCQFQWLPRYRTRYLISRAEKINTLFLITHCINPNYHNSSSVTVSRQLHFTCNTLAISIKIMDMLWLSKIISLHFSWEGYRYVNALPHVRPLIAKYIFPTFHYAS